MRTEDEAQAELIEVGEACESSKVLVLDWAAVPGRQIAAAYLQRQAESGK